MIGIYTQFLPIRKFGTRRNAAKHHRGRSSVLFRKSPTNYLYGFTNYLYDCNNTLYDKHLIAFMREKSFEKFLLVFQIFLRASRLSYRYFVLQILIYKYLIVQSLCITNTYIRIFNRTDTL